MCIVHNTVLHSASQCNLLISEDIAHKQLIHALILQLILHFVTVTDTNNKNLLTLFFQQMLTKF